MTRKRSEFSIRLDASRIKYLYPRIDCKDPFCYNNSLVGCSLPNGCGRHKP